MEGLYKVKIAEAQLNEAALAAFGRRYDNVSHVNWTRDNLKDGLRRFLVQPAIG